MIHSPQVRGENTVDDIAMAQGLEGQLRYLEATARILVGEGFDKASTNRIAEVASVSVGSLYQYFPSKEALEALVEEATRLVVGYLTG